MHVTELLCLADSYLRTAGARVIDLQDRNVVLDRTLFYPRGGGQMSDGGTLTVRNRRYPVVAVEKRNAVVFHTIDGPLPPLGARAVATIDWEFRYTMMRLHSAAHVVAGVIRRHTGAAMTGCRLHADRAQLDITPGNLSPAQLSEIEHLSNKTVQDGHPVRSRYIPRADMPDLHDPVHTTSIDPLARAPEPVRVIEIVDLDLRADEGTHVANTLEVAGIRITSAQIAANATQRLEIELLPLTSH